MIFGKKHRLQQELKTVKEELEYYRNSYIITKTAKLLYDIIHKHKLYENFRIIPIYTGAHEIMYCVATPYGKNRLKLVDGVQAQTYFSPVPASMKFPPLTDFQKGCLISKDSVVSAILQGVFYDEVIIILSRMLLGLPIDPEAEKSKAEQLSDQIKDIELEL